MTNQPIILDGAALAKRVLGETAERVARIKQQTGKTPALATVLIGGDPSSQTYVRMKRKRCEAVGMRSVSIEMDESSTTEAVVERIRSLSDDPAINGILLQHPAPSQVDERAAFEAIAPEKDVDGVTITSFAAMAFGHGGYASCTPGGIMRLLEAYDVSLQGLHAVVVGRSAILGKPMAMMLLAAHCTVTICHSRTLDLPSLVRQADLVVGAVGKPKFIQGEWIKPGAIVIDAGYTGNAGDVDLEAAAEHAAMYTPVPGGVGPMTIATLISQTADAAERQWGISA